MSRTTRKVLSQSQILRNTFYHLWEIDNEGFEDYDDYYEAKMKAVNIHYKNLLEKKLRSSN